MNKLLNISLATLLFLAWILMLANFEASQIIVSFVVPVLVVTIFAVLSGIREILKSRKEVKYA